MFDMFYPDRYIASTYVIDFEKLYEEGYRGLIFDIDRYVSPPWRAGGQQGDNAV